MKGSHERWHCLMADMTTVNGQSAQSAAVTAATPIKATPWLLRFAPRPAARLRLFCFSYAGAGGAMYRTWLDALPPSIELCAVQLPGRENRFREPAFTSMQRLVETMVPALSPAFDLPYAFFGHSMGALVAFELARALHALPHVAPLTHLLVSGRKAPHLPEDDAPMRGLADDAFIAEIGRRYGGIPDEVLRERDLLDLLLPGLRADMTAIETHAHRAGAAVALPDRCVRRRCRSARHGRPTGRVARPHAGWRPRAHLSRRTLLSQRCRRARKPDPRIAQRPSRRPCLMSSDPVAIVGIGCRFPGGVVDAQTFWQLLIDGRDAVGEIPADRIDIARFFDRAARDAGAHDVSAGRFPRWHRHVRCGVLRHLAA